MYLLFFLFNKKQSKQQFHNNSLRILLCNHFGNIFISNFPLYHLLRYDNSLVLATGSLSSQSLPSQSTAFHHQKKSHHFQKKKKHRPVPFVAKIPSCTQRPIRSSAVCQSAPTPAPCERSGCERRSLMVPKMFSPSTGRMTPMVVKMVV